MDVAIGLCSCVPPCGRLSSTGWYCKIDRKMHLGKYSLESFIDVLINHEAIHKLIHELEGLQSTKAYNNMFRLKRGMKPSDLSRKSCLKVLRENGTPQPSVRQKLRWFISTLVVDTTM